MSVISNGEQLRDEWLARLSNLVHDIESWSQGSGWSTRQIEVALEDSEIGKYQAPALLIQDDAIKILLEPIARSAPGAEGVVDLYLMPAYDDIASLYLYDDGWHLHYMFPGTPDVATIRHAKDKKLTKDSLQEVLEEMKQNAVH